METVIINGLKMQKVIINYEGEEHDISELMKIIFDYSLGSMADMMEEIKDLYALFTFDRILRDDINSGEAVEHFELLRVLMHQFRKLDAENVRRYPRRDGSVLELSAKYKVS